MSMRILGIPPTGIPPHSVPVYGLPSLDVNFTTESLQIIRGGVVLDNPAFVEASRVIDLRVNETRTRPQTLGFQFTVKNPASNPDAEITGFSESGYISIFEAFNSETVLVGITLADTESFRVVFLTDFDSEVLGPGRHYLTGAWSIQNFFDGTPGVIETNTVNISYTVVVPGGRAITKDNPLTPGKIAPHAYINEFNILNKQEQESFEAGKSRKPGTQE